MDPGAREATSGTGELFADVQLVRKEAQYYTPAVVHVSLCVYVPTSCRTNQVRERHSLRSLPRISHIQ